MPSLNRLQLIGRLGADPETHFTPNGSKVTRFSVAVDRRRRTPDGEILHETDWFNVEAWAKLGEVCQAYLKKGRLVFVEGRVQNDRYEKGGEIHYFSKLVLRNIELLDRKPEEEAEEVAEEDVNIE